MKLFLREQRLLLIVQAVQLLFISSMFLLSGYKDYFLLLYISFIVFFILSIYLIYMYLTRRRFYRLLSSSIKHLDDSLQKTDSSPISQSLNKLLRSQYEVYINDIIELKKKQKEHLIFMDRWVHQMKTPVSVMELIARDLDEPEGTNLREELDRMKTGLNTVLHMARLRSIDRDIHIRLVNVEEIIIEVNKELKRYFITNQVYPKLQINSENTYVQTDAKWIHLIFTQFIQNAVKYSRDKSKDLSLRLYDEGKIRIFEIEDYGIGIPEEDMKRIFDPFFTGENGRKYHESTGVGLYLVKEVSNYLGHKIKIQSVVGKGTIVRIYFHKLIQE